MSKRTNEEIISGYLANHATGDKSYFWAYEEMSDVISKDAERAWSMTVEMIRQTTDQGTLAYIAAGPLEDLIAWYGNQFIERTEVLARTEPHFRYALQNVYVTRFTPGNLCTRTKSLGQINKQRAREGRAA